MRNVSLPWRLPTVLKSSWKRSFSKKRVQILDIDYTLFLYRYICLPVEDKEDGDREEEHEPEPEEKVDLFIDDVLQDQVRDVQD